MKIKLFTLIVLCLILSNFNSTPIKINLAGDSTMADGLFIDEILKQNNKGFINLLINK